MAGVSPKGNHKHVQGAGPKKYSQHEHLASTAPRQPDKGGKGDPSK